MSNKIFVGEAGKLVHVPRHCSHCGHAYSARFYIKCLGGGSILSGSSVNSESAIGQAHENLDRIVRFVETNTYCAHTYGVLCPKCNRFSSESILFHFPRGIKSSMLDRLQSGYPPWGILHTLALILVLCVFNVGIFGFLEPSAMVEGDVVLFQLSMLGAVAPAVLIHFIMRRIRRKRFDSIKETVSDLSPEELHDFLCRVYTLSSNSLNLEALFGTSCKPLMMPNLPTQSAASRLLKGEIPQPAALYNFDLGERWAQETPPNGSEVRMNSVILAPKVTTSRSAIRSFSARLAEYTGACALQ